MVKVRVGSLYARSVRLLARNFVRFTTVSLVIQGGALFFPRPDGTWARLGWLTASNLLSYLLTALLVPAVIEELRGRRPGFITMVRDGLRAIGPALAVGLVEAALVSLGTTFAFAVPGLVVMTALLVAIPIAVVERRGLAATLLRSWRLTEGNKLRLFGALLLVMLSIVIPAGFVSVSWRHGGAWTPELHATADLIMRGAGVLLDAWLAILATVAYHDLRVAREGDPDAVARVFD